MRFCSDGPSIPDALLERCDAGRIVFLCGAGVSLNSGMPDFIKLTKHVIDFFGPAEDSEIIREFSPWQPAPSTKFIPTVTLNGSDFPESVHPTGRAPLDRIFNLLHKEYGRDEVNELVTERLRSSPDTKFSGYEHNLIKRISSNQKGIPQIVTTNFDLLFENQADNIPIHIPPEFPDLAFGSSIGGITYLHGRLESPEVLSSADFGRAYLSEAWATKFIRELLERYTVVLVGYQAEDPPVKYLLEGLNDDEQFNSTQLYAFDRGEQDEIETIWRDRGVTPIAYQGQDREHIHLWDTMAAWAERTDNPRAWRNRIVASAERDPKMMLPHERGQVAHVLRSVPGARAFADAEPSPHPEWICVLDAFTRNAKQSKCLNDHSRKFDPVLAYGLDDDFVPISREDSRRGINNDNLLEWRNGDNNPPEFHRLSGRSIEGFETMPTRLEHLMCWIGKSFQSPAIAWWAVHQDSLHPLLIGTISKNIDITRKVDKKCQQIWNLILEYHQNVRRHQKSRLWNDLKKRIAAEGWTPSVLRGLHHVFQPYLDISRPIGLHESKPPTLNWDKLQINEIVRIEVKYLDHYNQEFDIPDQVLPVVFGFLVNHLSTGAGMLSDLGVSYLSTPTCFPDRETDSGDHCCDFAEIFHLFITLFDRIVTLNPKLAIAHVTLWDEGDSYFFRKFKLYALSKPNLFGANDAARIICSFNQETFWDINVVRELLFTLVDRWIDFSDEKKEALARRIVAGPDRMNHWSEEEYPTIRDRFAAKYGRYLQLNKCDLPDTLAMNLANIIAGIPDWTDDLSKSMVIEYSVHDKLIEKDMTSRDLVDLPINKVVDRVKINPPRITLDQKKMSFTGFVKKKPNKALSSLSIAAMNGDYPAELWSVLVNEMPASITPEIRKSFLICLAHLPHTIVTEIQDALSQWLKQNLVAMLQFDCNLGWNVFDYIFDCILNREVNDSGNSVDNDGSLGTCLEALVSALPGNKKEADSLGHEHIKPCVDRIFAAPEKVSDRAMCIAISKLNLFISINPYWTKKHLVPLLDFDHPVSETAWSRLFLNGGVLSEALAEIIKPLMLNLFPWIEKFSWKWHTSMETTQWLVQMYVCYPEKPSELTMREMRNILRAMSDDSRSRFINWLEFAARNNEICWVTHIIPFIDNVWPKEKRYRTSGSVSSWINLLHSTGNNFPATYKVVKKFLVSVKMIDSHLHRFTYMIADDEPLTVRFPERTLDLLNHITPGVLSQPPFVLPKVLALIAETDVKLTSDPRYLRLIDLIEQS